MPVPVIRIAPYPKRLTLRSPPSLKVPLLAAFGVDMRFWITARDQRFQPVRRLGTSSLYNVKNAFRPYRPQPGDHSLHQMSAAGRVSRAGWAREATRL